MPTEIGTIVAHVNGEDCTYHLVLLDAGPLQPVAIGPYADCTGLDVSFLDMTDWDVRSASFSDGKLNSTILNGADARGMQLENVVAHDVKLEGTKLQGAKARAGDFTGAHAPRVVLTGADVTYSVWLEADLDEDALVDVMASKGIVRRWADLGRPDIDESLALVRDTPPTPIGEPPAWIVADENAHARLEAIEREQVSGLLDQDTFKKFLDLQSRFISFTPRNVLLIAGQMPDATWLASYDKWTEYGRHVQLQVGERPVEIRLPYTPAEGAMSPSAKRKSRVVQLLDVMQTAGVPASELGAYDQWPVESDVFEQRLAAYTRRHGVVVDPEDPDVVLASIAEAAVCLSWRDDSPGAERIADLAYYLAARNIRGHAALTGDAPAASNEEDSGILLEQLAAAQSVALLITKAARDEAPPAGAQEVYDALRPWSDRELYETANDAAREAEARGRSLGVEVSR